MNTQSNTFYFGRYSISAPTDGSGIWTSYKIIQKDLQFISKNGKRDINIKVDESIAEINTLHKAGYKAFDQKIPLDGGGIIVVSKSINYDFDIYYLTSSNTLYRQTVESISIDAFDKAVGLAKDLNSMIHYRHPNSNPPEGTFAIDAGYMTLPSDKYPEQVSIGLPISTIPGIHVIFDTQVIRKPEPGLDTLPALAPQSLPFHTQSVPQKQDGITQWSSGSQLLSGKLNWRSVDYLAHSQPRESVMLRPPRCLY